MRSIAILFSAIFALALTGCGGGSSGACNVCPNDTNVNSDACAEQGKAKNCASAEYKEVTDTNCDIASPATAHMACVYEDCDEGLTCEEIAGP